MATQVNKKIVVGIVAGIVGLSLGVVALALYTQQQSGEKNFARGLAAMKAADYEKAESQFSRAVNKDQTNVEYIDKWAEALVLVTPETHEQYKKIYGAYVSGALEKKATQRPSDGPSQLEYIEELVESRGFNLGLAAHGDMVATIESRAAGLSEDDPYRARVLRYRGRDIAGKAAVLEISDEEYQQAAKDLRDAYEVTDDPRILKELYALHGNVRNFALSNVDTDRAEEATVGMNETEQELVSKHADHPAVITLEYAKNIRQISPDTPREARREAVARLTDEAMSRFERVDFSEHKATDLIFDMQSFSRGVSREATERLKEMTARLLEVNPDDHRVVAQLARLEATMRNYDEAVKLYERIAEMPNKPVSIEGFSLVNARRLSYFERSQLRLRQAQFSPKEERPALIEQARELRNGLAERKLQTEDYYVKLLDTKLALAEEDYDTALTLLNDLESLPRLSRSIRTTVLLGYVEAFVGMKPPQPGNAKAKLQELVQMGGAQSGQALLYAAEIERMLGNYEPALSYYVELQKLVPNDESIALRISQLRSTLGIASEDEADPVIVAANRARELRSEGDIESALAVLEASLEEAPGDQRLIRMIVSLDISLNERDRAAQRLRAELAKKPGDAFLQNMLTQVTIDDPVEAQLAIIESTDDSPLVKALAREAVYRAGRRTEEADEQLEIARGIDAQNIEVIARGFVRGASKGKAGLDEVERVVQAAASSNADGHDGQVYRARFEILKNNPQEAIGILTGITNDNPYDAGAWRWLGAAQRAAGLIEASVDSYAKAYEANPRDIGFATDYANALVAAGRGVDAAAVLSPDTGVLRFSGAGDRIFEMWLNIEGRFGDRGRVMKMREESFKREPSAIQNTIAYVQLLLQAEDFEKAERAIGTYAALPDARKITAAQLRSARFAAMEDFESAVAQIENYLAQTPESELTTEPFLILAKVYETAGNLDGAAAAYERGRPYQGERRMLDRSLADLRFRTASATRNSVILLPETNADRIAAEPVWKAGYAAALDLYKDLLSRGEFDELLAKRIAESQLRTGQYSELDKTLDRITQETGNDTDLQVLLMRAVAAEDRGEDAQRDEYLNRAVESNSTNPLAFFKRAQVNSAKEERLPDVVADLEEAVKLRPGYVEAWTLLAQTYARMGQADQAFQKLRSAIESNPNNVRLPRVLVDLLERTGQVAEAFNYATKRANDNPEDLFWINRVAKLAQRAGNFDDAYRWLTIQDELSEFKEQSIALDRLSALLRRSSGVDIPEVNRLMRRVEAIEVEGDANIVLKLLRARGEEARGNTSKADQLFFEAHDLAREVGPVALRLVVEGLMLRYMQNSTQGVAQQKMYAFISENEQFRTPYMHPYLKMELLEPNILGAETMEQRNQLNEALEAVSKEIDPEDVVTMLRYYRLASSLRYDMKDFEGAIEASRAALQIAPNNADMANNLAYTLSTELGRHEEALPYAVTAAAVAPDRSYVQDTLGIIQLRLDKVDEAIDTLTIAIARATTSDTRAVAMIHKIQALIASEQISEAKLTLPRAQREMNEASPKTRELYSEELQALIDRLQ